MSYHRPSKLTKKRFFLIVIAAAVAAICLGAGGFAFAASMEQNDSFCASCHTQPESTYYQRTLDNAPVDLASVHHQKQTNCIDCHSAAGILGRISAEMMGAQNAFKWFTGTAIQPAPLAYPIGDSNCLKCHAEVPTKNHEASARSREFGPKGHYHTLLARWKAADQAASANCTACHSGHNLGADSGNTWIVSSTIENVCESCHNTLGRD